LNPFTFKPLNAIRLYAAVLPLLVCLAPPAQANLLSRAVVQTQREPVVLEEAALPDGKLERRFVRGTTVLYRTVTALQNDGFEVWVAQGHPSQLGRFTVKGQQLSVQNGQGEPLWTETLSRPLCLPELAAEFVRAHWAQLKRGSEPLACVTPIIKARKVAPVQWVRLPDGANGVRVVELQPGSLGMRLFLSPTRMTFSADGSRLLAHEGQFESTANPDGRARYLKGTASYSLTRVAAEWPTARFGATLQP
jgi:hypothetical protein